MPHAGVWVDDSWTVTEEQSKARGRAPNLILAFHSQREKSCSEAQWSPYQGTSGLQFLPSCRPHCILPWTSEAHPQKSPLFNAREKKLDKANQRENLICTFHKSLKTNSCNFCISLMPSWVTRVRFYSIMGKTGVWTCRMYFFPPIKHFFQDGITSFCSSCSPEPHFMWLGTEVAHGDAGV